MRFLAWTPFDTQGASLLPISTKQSWSPVVKYLLHKLLQVSSDIIKQTHVIQNSHVWWCKAHNSSLQYSPVFSNPEPSATPSCRLLCDITPRLTSPLGPPLPVHWLFLVCICNGSNSFYLGRGGILVQTPFKLKSFSPHSLKKGVYINCLQPLINTQPKLYGFLLKHGSRVALTKDLLQHLPLDIHCRVPVSNRLPGKPGNRSQFCSQNVTGWTVQQSVMQFALLSLWIFSLEHCKHM